NGLSGSTGALLLQSLYTGVPNRPSHRLQQDDFICDINYRLGGTIPVWQSPSVVVRVYLPPVDQGEDRSGPTFAFRAAVDTTPSRSGGRLSSSSKRETFWPGMFIEFESKTTTGRLHDVAFFRIRANENGGDYKGPYITKVGWWTL